MKKNNKLRGKKEEGEGTWYCKMNCQVKVTYVAFSIDTDIFAQFQVF